MKKALRKISIFAILTLLSVALPAFVALISTSSQNQKTEGLCASLVSDEAEKIVIASTDGSDFSMYFSSDEMQADQLLAADIEKAVSTLFGIRLRPRADISAKPDKCEILIGNTNRPESDMLIQKINTTQIKDELVWGFAIINGKLLYTANSEEAFNYGKDDFTSYLSENSYTVPADLLVISTKSREEYEAEIKAAEDAEKQEIINALIEKNNAFTQEQFGGAPREMGESPYAPPEVYPVANMHPRLFITESEIDDVLEIMTDPMYKKLVADFWEEVELEGCIDGFTRVYYDDPNGLWPNEFGENYYAYSIPLLSALQNKAFAYLLTGNVQYAYEAVIGVKNAMLTLTFSSYIHTDNIGPSHLFSTVAKIYDWCYDMLSEDDKNQLIAGISNIMAPRMTFSFPPTNLNGVSGHGTGPQFLRDYIMVSLAFYDEMPDWWEFVGGRYFEEYVPVVNVHTENGWVTQGTACYGPSKFYDGIISARMLYQAAGRVSYNEEGLKIAPYYVLSHIQPNGLNFQTGDGPRTERGATIDYSYIWDVIALYKDPVLLGYLYDITDNLNSAAKPDRYYDLPICKLLCYMAYFPSPDFDYKSKLDTIQYFEEPAASMTARSSWTDENAVAVIMKIGTKTMANHDIYDHGTFQIYYKGLLATSSGTYAKYGSNCHRYYLQSTVSNNGILVFNPAMSAEEPIFADGSDGTNLNDIINGASYFYSGSQKRRSEAGTIENLLSGSYDMGEITAHEIGYSYTDGTPEYGYIAGDIAMAYDIETVSYLERRMLTVFTDDPLYPALFFTFDTIEATDASFAKTYLLHTVKEPTIDEENMSVDIRQDGGRLFAQNLFGATSVEKHGGAGKAFWINGYYKADGTYVEGKNCADRFVENDASETIWGRAQFLAGGDAAQTQMLTAMFVTDAENEDAPLFDKFETDTVYGAEWGDIYTVFLKSRERQYKEFSFNTEGLGLSKYYVSGLEAGTWKILVDGLAVGTICASEEGGFTSFTAPCGEVVFKPTANVVGTNGGKIQYMTSGGMVGLNVPYTYRNETATPLTEDVKRGSDTFLGWYTSPTFEPETRVTEIPAGTKGLFRIYAKWLSVFVDEDYTKTTVNLTEMSKQLNEIAYTALEKPGASFKTKTDSEGVRYLEWIEGTKDPIISVTNSTKNFSTMATEDETVSFELSIARDGDNPIIPLSYRIMSNVKYETLENRVYGEYKLITLSESGIVRLAGGPVIGDISGGERLDIRVAVDFKNARIVAYDKMGAEMQSVDITVPAGSGAPNASEWRKLMKSYIAYIYAEGAANLGASLRLYRLKVSESNVLANPELEDIAIEYHTGGGTLSDDAPFYYEKGRETPLPEIYKHGAIFGGWYTTETFDEDSRVSAVPADHEGPFKVYALWTLTFVDTDFRDSNLDGNSTQNASHAGVDFLTNTKPGATALTKTDESGKTYIEWVKGSGDSILQAINKQDNFSTMSSGLASYSLKFRKKTNTPLITFSQVILESNVTASGTAGVYAPLILFKINAAGEVTAGTGGTVVTTIKEDAVAEINFTIDFKAGKLTYYDSEGNPICDLGFTAPEKSEAQSTEEWQRLIQTYFLYMRAGDASQTPESALLVYGIKIAEGNIFTQEGSVDTQNRIIYTTNGGKLPAGAPGEYDPAADTPLPTIEKEGSAFGGWYTTPTFEDGTRVNKIPAGTSGAFLAYARWVVTFIDTDFSGSALAGSDSENASFGGIDFYTKNKVGSAAVTKVDEKGRTYVEFVKGESDAIISAINEHNSIADIGSHTVSYSFKLGKKTGTPVITTTQVTLDSNVKANGAGGFAEISLFSIAKDGTVTAGKTDVVIATLRDGELTEVNFTVDFKSGKLTYYTADGEIIHERTFTAPEASGAASTLEWQRLIKKYYFYLRATDNSDPVDSTLLLYGVTVREGNIFE